jgi:hypothetical protein
MQHEPQESAAFVAEFLRSDDDAVAEIALLALGNSRRAEAFVVLRSFWEGRPRNELHETTLVAMALLRFSAATDFLLALLSDTPESSARQALSALATLNYDPRVCELVASAVERRQNDQLIELFETKFRTNRG